MGKITKTNWGSYNVLFERNGYKIKTLHINPGESYYKNNIIDIPVENWHKPANISNSECIVCEIQYGKECIEQDIERR